MFSFIAFRTRWTKMEVNILEENFGDLIVTKKFPTLKKIRKLINKHSLDRSPAQVTIKLQALMKL